MAGKRAAARAARAAAEEEALRRIAAGTAVLPPATVLPLEKPNSVSNPVNWKNVSINKDDAYFSNRYGKYGLDAPDPDKESPTGSIEAALQRLANAPQRKANSAIYSTFTDEEKELSTQTNLLKKYGITSADIGNKVLTEDQMFELTSKLDNEITDWQTTNLSTLASEDPAAFAQEYGKLYETSQLKFLNSLYESGSLSKDEYLNASAQTLMAGDTYNKDVYIIDKGKLYAAPSQSADNPNFYNEVVLFPNQVSGQNKYNTFDYKIGGQAPTSDFDASGVTKFLNSAPIKMAASMFGLPGVAVLTGLRAANGETLHAEDWATLAMAGVGELKSVAGNPAAEAAANADVAANNAVDSAIAEYNSYASGFPAGTFIAPDLTAVYDAAYDASIAASGVTTTFMALILLSLQKMLI